MCPTRVGQKRLHQLALLVGIDRKKYDIRIVAESLLHLLIQRMLHPARLAPRSPEIEDHYLAFERWHFQSTAVRCGESELHRIGKLGIGIVGPHGKLARMNQREVP